MSTPLNVTPNFEDADGFYASLTAAHEALDKKDSDALNARLIFLLANHIGDAAVLDAAVQAAKASAHNR